MLNKRTGNATDEQDEQQIIEEDPKDETDNAGRALTAMHGLYDELQSKIKDFDMKFKKATFTQDDEDIEAGTTEKDNQGLVTPKKRMGKSESKR
jgi:hypothetical protein